MKKLLQLSILVAVTAIFFVATFFVVSRSNKKSEGNRDNRQFNKMFASKLASWGSMTEEEATRNLQIRDISGKLSDSDLDFVLMLLKTGTSNSNSAKSVRRQEAISTLIKVTDKKQIDEKQKEKIYEAIVKILNEKDESYEAINSKYLLREARSLNDPRLIPCVLPLLNDPHPKVKESARKTLSHLGYK